MIRAFSPDRLNTLQTGHDLKGQKFLMTKKKRNKNSSVKHDRLWKLRKNRQIGCAAVEYEDLVVKNVRTGELGKLSSAIIKECSCISVSTC